MALRNEPTDKLISRFRMGLFSDAWFIALKWSDSNCFLKGKKMAAENGNHSDTGQLVRILNGLVFRYQVLEE
jgi:hypothetical protein